MSASILILSLSSQRTKPPWKSSPDEQDGYENGKAFSGTKGILNLGKSCDCKMFSPGNKLVEERSGGFDQPAHHETFHAAVRHGAMANAVLKRAYREGH